LDLFTAWAGIPGEPGKVFDLRKAGALNYLTAWYAPVRPIVFREVLSQAYASGAQTAVAEYRYLDPDYRNEHSRFYSSTFRRYPSVAHRIHFFSDPPPEELDDARIAARFDRDSYLGYSVLRPVAGGPVGRTMLTIPGELAGQVSCAAEDKVNLFGWPFQVTAAPLMAQDAQLSRCAHATVWVVAYLHHLKYGAPRRLPGEIADAVPVEVGMNRPTPSVGLAVNQLLEASRRMGLPCLAYRLDGKLPPDETLYSLACRYLNSGLPVIVAAGSHAFVLVGYQAYKKDGQTRFRFIRQDDEAGPYRIVDNPFHDKYGDWWQLIVPLPEKIYLSGDAAEALGKEQLEAMLGNSWVPGRTELRNRLENKEIRFRSTVVLSNDFKVGLTGRGMDQETAAIFHRMQMSRWIWVVEAVDASARDRGEPCVIAEAIIDATDHALDPHVLGWRFPKTVYQWFPDENIERLYPDLTELPLLKSLVQVDQKVA
jgi:hypothetical protein